MYLITDDEVYALHNALSCYFEDYDLGAYEIGVLNHFGIILPPEM